MHATTMAPQVIPGVTAGLAPTSLGTGNLPVAQAPTAESLSLPANFPTTVDEALQARVQARVAKFDFRTLAPRDINLLGYDAWQALAKDLDRFLARIDQQDSPQLFKLVASLQEAVDREQLPDLAKRILDAKPTLLQRFIGLFSRKQLMKAIERAYEDAGRLVSGRSRRLSDVVNGLEAKLRADLVLLDEEMRHMDSINADYRKHFLSFAEETIFLHNVVLKARIQLAEFLATGPDVLEIAAAEDKLQALESRALDVEAGMTGLPAKQMAMRQAQNAGVKTHQELTGSMAGRFVSIKQTLILLHGTLRVQNAQRGAQQGANLDANLALVTSQLLKEVVTTAANAPGDNRKAQAEQLKQIVVDMAEMQQIVDAAKVSNKQKFAEARADLAQVRQDMLGLGRVLAPGQPLQY